MKKFLGLISIVCCSLMASAQSWADTLTMISTIVSRYQPANPGAQLAISRNGQVIFSQAWGMADLEHQVPLTTTSLTEAGSVSKQFTAASILLLEQQGKLSIEDDVRKYIPELPDYGTTMRLRHLMQHTSGLRDWGTVMELSGWPRGTRNYTNEYALMVITQQKTLNNQPGAEYIYSNSNYNLLATIVERVSGKSLQQFTNENIFQPAGMKHTEWRANHKKVVLNRAIAYSKGTKNYLTNMPSEDVHGHGGLLTTAEDLLAWNAFYWGGKFGRPSLLDKQLATHPLNNGVRNTYAAGLGVDSVMGWKIVTHNGATASYRANLDHFPDLGLSIAWLSNTSEFDRDTANVANNIRRLFVKNIQIPRPKDLPTAGFVISEAALQQYTGWYRNERDDEGVKVSLKNGSLYRGNIKLSPVAVNQFSVAGNKIEILPGKQRQVLLLPLSGDTIRFTGVDSAVLHDKRLQEYAGAYYSAEATANFTIAVQEGKLLLRQQPSAEFQLDPTYQDGFESLFGPLYFMRDKKNKVIGFRISLSRARKVAFVRNRQ